MVQISRVQESVQKQNRDEQVAFWEDAASGNPAVFGWHWLQETELGSNG
jgi:hypothetical protein